MAPAALSRLPLPTAGVDTSEVMQRFDGRTDEVAGVGLDHVGRAGGASMEWFVPAPGGRTLAVEDAGDRGGRPVMVHVGTPGGRRLYGPRTLADAERRQLRLISYDRPGYGGSTAQPGRSTADCACDVRVICEALGIERLAMWGLSGGGPHVLACAALLPDLVTAVASLASLAPYDAEGWTGSRASARTPSRRSG